MKRFLERPYIAAQIAAGKLMVREAMIDTATGKLINAP